MSTSNEEGLGYIVQAINNIVDSKINSSKFDKTYRAKIIGINENDTYLVEIANNQYSLKYNGELNIGDIIRVKAPLNNFSDIYIEAVPDNEYSNLSGKPILNTENSDSLDTDIAEIVENTISLHKISKTGSYTDLNNLPELVYSELGFDSRSFEVDTGNIPLQNIIWQVNNDTNQLYEFNNNRITFKRNANVRVGINFFINSTNRVWIELRQISATGELLQVSHSIIPYNSTSPYCTAATEIYTSVNVGDYIEMTTSTKISLNSGSGNSNSSKLFIQELI